MSKNSWLQIYERLPQRYFTVATEAFVKSNLFIGACEAFARKHPTQVIEMSDPTELIEGAFSTDRYTRNTARRRMRVAALEALEESDSQIENLKAMVFGCDKDSPAPAAGNRPSHDEAAQTADLPRRAFPESEIAARAKTVIETLDGASLVEAWRILDEARLLINQTHRVESNLANTDSAGRDGIHTSLFERAARIAAADPKGSSS